MTTMREGIGVRKVVRIQRAALAAVSWRSGGRRLGVGLLALTAVVLQLQSSPANAVQAFPYSGGRPFGSTNGNKVVVQGGLIHAVYADSTGVHYRSRPNGYNSQQWSDPPVTLSSPGCNQPTIAVDSAGHLVAAFVCNGSELWYASKLANGDWEGADAPIDSGFSSLGHPSMVAYGADVHIAWELGNSIRYITFPTVSPRQWASSDFGAYVVQPLGGTIEVNTFLPSIAVATLTAGSPVVQVAYFEHVKFSFPESFGVVVRRKPAPASGTFPLVWDWEHEYTRIDGPAPAGESISLASNSAGAFLLAWSDVASFPVKPRTMLAKMNPNSTWENAVEITPQPTRSLVDVAYINGPYFLYVYTDLGTSTAASGPLKSIDGWWTLASPHLGGTYSHSFSSRDPQVVAPSGVCPRIMWDNVGTTPSIDQDKLCPPVTPGGGTGVINAVQRSIRDKAGCYAKAITRGLAVEPTCLSNASARFAAALTRAQGGTDSGETLDQGALESTIDGGLSDVQTQLAPIPGASKCTARKLVAAGKQGGGLLHAKAIRTGSEVDPKCLDREDTRLISAFDRAEKSGDCLAPAGDAFTIKVKVDALVDAVVCEIDPTRCPQTPPVEVSERSGEN